MLPFIENKDPKFDLVVKLLARSAAENRWTNFGPVWRQLKENIENQLGLRPSRCAIPCASGTHALLAAAAIIERQDRRNWFVSGYGFRSNVIGPFSQACIVDSDMSGLLDLEKLEPKTLGPNAAILATNPFGLRAHMDEYIAFARRTGAALIVDNAAGYCGFSRSKDDGIFECLSFHHTKPLGFGEGGCLIVDRALESDALTAIDFGYRWNWPGGAVSLSNGKLSEIAAASLLARHQDAKNWSSAFKEQFCRIRNIGEQLGFRLLIDPIDVGDGVYGNVPLVWHEPIKREALDNEIVRLEKYYRPFSDRVIADKLFRHIVNVPCHPEMANLGNRELETVLRRITQ